MSSRHIFPDDVLRMLFHEVNVITLQRVAHAIQLPFHQKHQFQFEVVELLKGYTADFCVMGVGAVRIADGFARDGDCRDHESMNRE